MKITTKLFMLAVFAFFMAKASATVFTTDLYKFQFNNLLTSSYPTTPVVTATTGTTTSQVFATGSGAAALNASTNFLFSGGGGGNRGSFLANLNGNTALPTNKKIVVEFEWNPNTTGADALAYNALALSDASNRPIFILVNEIWSATNSGVHLMNLTPAKLATNWFLTAPAYVTTGDYKTDCVNAIADSRLSANSPYDFPNNKTYFVKAKLDFSTQKIDTISITRADDTNIKYVGTDIAFLSATAVTNADKLSALAVRGKNQTNSGNGGNSHLWMTVDNYSVYTWEDVPTATVTVRYHDAGNNALFTTVPKVGVVGSTYTISDADKKSFTFGGNYCVYSSIISDNVTVAADGSSYVRLKMKRYPVSAGTYSWVGNTDANWNELTANFTTDGSNSLGYQPGNPVLFGAAGINKTVNVNDLFDMGAGDITVNADGYTVSGNGTIIGTGKLAVNLNAGELATINFSNNLSGGTVISGGSAKLAKTGAFGTSLTVNGVSTIIPSTGVVIPATTFNSSAELACDTFYTSISNISAIAGTKIAVSSAYNTSASGIVSMTFGAGGTLPAGSELEFNGTGTVENKFGMTSASTTYLANAKVTLKGKSFLFIDTNQGAATTINVGTLAGESTAKLGWGRSSALDRTITWSVGASNESSEYAGIITNTGGYASGGNMYVGNLTHLIKEGTGTLTLSGRANKHNGNFTVNNGTLLVTDSICKSTSTVTVGANAKLTGTGVIGGAATINGTLEGRLTFASSLTLAGTTKIVVNGFNAGEYDAINAVGALTYGGVLEVTVNGGNPAIGTSIKIANFGSQTGDFTQPVSIPANYSFNKTTGMLTYDGPTTGIESGLANQVRIYPTITNGLLHVDGDVSRVQVVNSLGQILMNKSGNGVNTQLNLNSLAAGTYMIKVNAIDGSATTKVVFYQK